MTKFGLVVLGAHIGIHIKSEIEKILPEKVLLVEPVPHSTEVDEVFQKLQKDKSFIRSH